MDTEWFKNKILLVTGELNNLNNSEFYFIDYTF